MQHKDVKGSCPNMTHGVIRTGEYIKPALLSNTPRREFATSYSRRASNLRPNLTRGCHARIANKRKFELCTPYISVDSQRGQAQKKSSAMYTSARLAKTEAEGVAINDSGASLMLLISERQEPERSFPAKTGGRENEKMVSP
ncbi:hypothetical protein L916_04156 [Phytophthora nicotianae]|uniref:Uncharacterized protein n=1 Tax=Phytophthora nicotianae TaxID=4792 RepID=W2JHR3_PHYNI|nr:hypothetical protein L916_04156 [Phytophthora nicotianae]